MPINNKLFGVYKIIKFKLSTDVSPTTPYIIENYSPTDTMDASGKTYIQGSPKTKIMSIGKARQDISVTAPLLIGGAAPYDGRSLFNDKLSEILTDPYNAVLPVLYKATLNLKEMDSNVVLNFKSDGNPNTTYDTIAISNGDATVAAALDANKSRTVSFYDVRVNLAGRYLKVMTATINVDINTSENVFLGAKEPSQDEQYWSTVSSNPLLDESGNYSGFQFPFISVGAVIISGSGTAAVEFEDSEDPDAINITFGTTLETNPDNIVANSNVTLQQPGEVITADGTFTLQIWDEDTLTWVDLIDNVDMSDAILKESAYTLTADLMTTNFSFVCYLNG